MTIIKGNVWKYGDDINTDVIFPGKYTYTVSDPNEMHRYALEDLDPRFAKEVAPNDIIVAGKNWGCGSSREQAVVCLKQSQVGAIIAKSFARIFYRNSINNALPVIHCPDAAEAILTGEQVEIDFAQGKIHCRAGSFKFPTMPQAVMDIFNAGGLIAYTKQRFQDID